jgi:hypothetical protein
VSVELPGEPATPRVHHFFWMEHLARDAGAALVFYKTLAGFGSSVRALPNGGEYHVLETDRPRAGLFQIPADATMVDPNWLPHVRVEDPAALAAKAASLGGTVLLAPRPDLRGGTVAVVADPTGGAFALQKWPL